MSQTETAIITVTCKDRGDGGVRVTSPDVPGLFLSGADRDAVLSDVEPAIRLLFRKNYGVEVVVRPVATSIKAIIADPEEQMPHPVIAAMETGQFAISRS